MHSEQGDAEAIEAALRRRVADEPDAVVGAVDLEGFFVPLPRALPLGGHATFRADHAIEIVAPEDAFTLLNGWDTVLAEGVGSVDVALADGTRAHIEGYDFREGHGVIAIVVTGPDGPIDPNVGVDDQYTQARPRVCRMRKNETSCIVDVDDAVTAMLGWTLDELQGQRQIDFVHPDDALALVDMWMRLISHPSIPQHVRARHRRQDGSYVWVELINQNRLHDPDHRDVSCDIIDISDQVAAEQALVAREELLKRLMESLPSGIAQIDDQGRLLSANDRLVVLLAAGQATSVEELLVNVVPDGREVLQRAVVDACRENIPAELELGVVVGGRRRTCQFVLRGLVDADEGSSHAVLSVTDVTDTVMARDRLVRQATIDPLTQCHNRAAVMEVLDRLAAEASAGRGVAAVFVDLDHFKDVNDRLGHAAGDELLQLVAARLRGALRGEDVVGRLGGDEFLVVCPNVETRAAADRLARRLRDAVEQPALVGGHPCVPEASIGLAWTDGDVDAGALVARADGEMYKAKRTRARAHSIPAGGAVADG